MMFLELLIEISFMGNPWTKSDKKYKTCPKHQRISYLTTMTHFRQFYPMTPIRILAASEQVAEHLRNELAKGTWSGLMPGSNRLARELGVGGNTLEAALKQLEKEGTLISQGPNRRRKINLTETQATTPLRIAFLHYDRPSRGDGYIIDLQNELKTAGHTMISLPKTMQDLKMDIRRISKMAVKIEADAWILTAATRDTLTWFAKQNTPTFALFGRRRGLPLAGAGPDKVPAYHASIRQLKKLGHRRIVLLTSKMRRLPLPGLPEQAFLDELRALGLPTGEYNLPDWEETPEGLVNLLDSLFSLTPPTALMIDEASHFIATQQYLARKGIIAPEKISLICTDAHPVFPWCYPSIAHIRWNTQPLNRRIVRWAENISEGKTDLRQTSTKAEFIAGATVGPVPHSSPPF
jgi:DNA-binding LacI/PurR family transcriptional regulator/DNA-binding MarR family transcriptional regulator